MTDQPDILPATGLRANSKRTAPHGAHPLESRLLRGEARSDDDSPDLGRDPAGFLLFEKEGEIDVLMGRILELEILLDKLSDPKMSREGMYRMKSEIRSALESNTAASMLRLYRYAMATVDRADWFLRGSVSRSELEEVIALTRSEFPGAR